MKGLLYSWFISRKTYWIIALIAFAALLTAIFTLLPHLEFLEPSIPAFAVCGLSVAVMAIPSESLCKELESSIKSRFADYALAAMSKKSYVSALLARNLILFGISLAMGYIILFSYILVTGTAVSPELVLLVPCIDLFVYAVDFICIPLVIKMKNAEKAGITVGACLGALVCAFMLRYNIAGDGNVTETSIFMIFDLTKEAIVIGALLAGYVIAYIFTLKIVKRGDVC